MKKLFFLVIAAFIVMNITACTVEKDVRIADGKVDVSKTKHERVFTDPAQTISVARGEIFSLSLESNPSTGFSWQFIEREKPGAVIFLSRVYEAPKSSRPMPGAPGRERFTFRAQSPGEEELVFQYLRPWEKNIPVGTTLTFRVKVR
ncbi:MAG: protease inhibitor I42 family protein [Syntrophorhabdus sp.]